MGKYVIAVDQSTSSTKGIIFNQKGQLVKRINIKHKQYYPKPGWVEHDAEEIYDNTLKVINNLIKESGISATEISALALTNQRETVVVWDRNTGKPIAYAPVWQCQRGNDICNDLKTKGYLDLFKKKTGLIIDPYFSASKIKWLLDNVKGAREKAEAGELLFGTMDCWLIWKLTAGKTHATDYSNASRTMLFNINNLNWDQDLFEIMDIPLAMAPEVKNSDEIFAYTSTEAVGTELPITGIMGDSHAALFGQNCFVKGLAKATYGTGSSIMMNIGEKPIDAKNGLVTSLAWGYNNQVNYVLEGNVHCTGDTIKWLVDDLELLSNAEITEELAKSVASNEGVYFVPAFVGLGAPYWKSDATATITGMTRGTKKAHLVRAALEAIAYQIKDVLDLMAREAGLKLKELRVDGGPTNNDFLMQFQADMLNIKVAKSPIEEVSALGSAYMAGLAVGLWNDLEEIKALRKDIVEFSPVISPEERANLYDGWKRAVKRTLFEGQ